MNKQYVLLAQAIVRQAVHDLCLCYNAGGEYHNKSTQTHLKADEVESELKSCGYCDYFDAEPDYLIRLCRELNKEPEKMHNFLKGGKSIVHE